MSHTITLKHNITQINGLALLNSYILNYISNILYYLEQKCEVGSESGRMSLNYLEIQL